MTWTPTSAGSYIKFSGAADAEKTKLIDSAKSGTPTFASGDVTVPINTGAVITNLFRNTTAATFYNGDITGIALVDFGVATNSFTYDLSEGVGSTLSSTELIAAASPFIPTLTANVDSGYTVSASSEYSSAYKAWEAVDGNIATDWASLGATDLAAGWWMIELPEAKAVAAFDLFQRTQTNQHWDNFTMEGSTDGVTFDLLHTGVWIDYNTQTKVPLDVVSTTKYTHLRFNGTNGVSGNPGLYNINFYEAVTKDITLVNSPTWGS